MNRLAIAIVLCLAGCFGKITGGGGASDDIVGGDDGPDPVDTSFQIQLVPSAGVTGAQRINFAVPLPPGLLTDATRIRVAAAGGAELPAARAALAAWPDGSIRSIQVQVDADAAATLDVEIDAASTGALTPVAVADTLGADGSPRVWAILPAAWLAPSMVAGPLVADLGAWSAVCDYARWNTDAFLAIDGEQGSWLFDRTTAMYRGYAITGDASVLASAYREATIYFAGLTGTGSATRIGVPSVAEDLKYHYTQGLAIHYLLTGDVRFREAAENVAIRAHDLWTSPGYAGGADFWTERHAGFGLLAQEWAAQVSDDRAATFAGHAAAAVDAYLDVQATDDAWEADAHCFAHTAEAHGEDYGYVGCSPWMSAILADGLDAYARRVGGTEVPEALARLGRMIARHGLADDGKPYYWMGAGVDGGEADEFEEHWGESAYVVALAWHWSGEDEPELRTAADALVDGLTARGEAGQLRSFNWQCRSAVMTPYLLR